MKKGGIGNCVFFRHKEGKVARKTGFTLIELVIVLIVLGILAAIAIPTYLSTLEKAKATEAMTQIDEIKTAQSGRAVSRGSYAASLTALGYPSDTWTPQTNWIYTLQNSGYNIRAEKRVAPSINSNIQMTLGPIVAANGNTPGPSSWMIGNHPGQP